jgi:phosphocarrier protein HPr
MRNCVKVKVNSIESAKEFSRICERFEEDIDYIVGRYTIDAKSILGILSTTLGKIAEVKICSKDLKTIELFFNSINSWIVEETI